MRRVGSEQSQKSRTPYPARNPPNEIQRILQFTEHAHGNDEEGNETDQGGDGAVDKVPALCNMGVIAFAPCSPIRSSN